MAKIKVGQVYENSKATFEILEIKTGASYPYRCKVTPKGSKPKRNMDLTEEQLSKMQKIKG